MSIPRFIEAFRTGDFFESVTCRCGRVYPEHPGGLSGVIRLVDHEYSDMCNCWHGSAMMLIEFIQIHSVELEHYLASADSSEAVH